MLQKLTCIKDMKKLEFIGFSNNQLTQLMESDIVDLQNLKFLNLTGNLIKDLTIEIFAPLYMSLNALFVDNLTSYENINSTLPQLKQIGLSYGDWNCTYLKNVNNIIKNQNIGVLMLLQFANKTENECKIPRRIGR